MNDEDVDSLLERADRGENFSVNPEVALLMVARQRDKAIRQRDAVLMDVAELRGVLKRIRRRG